jgi:DNA-binding transcriptional MerR regulator
MTIAEVGDKYNLPAATLRYYEQIGLIPPIPRTKGGLRNFGEKDIRWIEFIGCMRSAGVTIEILLRYVTLLQHGKASIQARRVLLIEQRQMIADQIMKLQTALARLDDKLDSYEERMSKSEDLINSPD